MMSIMENPVTHLSRRFGFGWSGLSWTSNLILFYWIIIFPIRNSSTKVIYNSCFRNQQRKQLNSPAPNYFLGSLGLQVLHVSFVHIFKKLIEKNIPRKQLIEHFK
jgi:hypothetical protein